MNNITSIKEKKNVDSITKIKKIAKVIETLTKVEKRILKTWRKTAFTSERNLNSFIYRNNQNYFLATTQVFKN